MTWSLCWWWHATPPDEDDGVGVCLWGAAAAARSRPVSQLESFIQEQAELCAPAAGQAAFIHTTGACRSHLPTSLDPFIVDPEEDDTLARYAWAARPLRFAAHTACEGMYNGVGTDALLRSPPITLL